MNKSVIAKLYVCTIMFVAALRLMATAIHTEIVDGIEWRYVVKDGEAASYGVAQSPMGAITIPSVLGGCPVTSIEAFAFEGCSGLTSVTIPNGVTSIGIFAFENCSGLTHVTIPNSVTWIGGCAFENCSGLTSVTIPNGVTSINGSTFLGCSSLTSVTIPNSVTSIEALAFDHSGLTSVVIPDCVTNIGGSAFHNCSRLENVTIGNGVISIGDRAFSGCDRLTSVIIPDSVINMGSWTFEYCSRLKTATIGNGAKYVGYSAFGGCKSLSSVTIGNNVKVIASFAFDRCYNLTSVIIPYRVTEIREYAFAECASLMNVTMPGRFETLEQSLRKSVFPGCPKDMVITYEDVGGPTGPFGCFLFFDANGGSCSTREKMVTMGEPCGQLPTPEKQGCVFAGWYTLKVSGTLITEQSIISDDMTVYAHWTISALTITFEAEGGLCDQSSRTVTYGSQIGVLPTPSRSGYVFVGWYTAQTEGERITEDLIVLSDSTFYAHWDVGSIPPDSDTPPEPIFDLNGDGGFGLVLRRVYLNNATEVIVPQRVTRIQDFAFSGCGRTLTRVTIPDGLTSIGYRAFAGCDGLMSFEVADGNPFYRSVSGMLLTKDGKNLVAGVNGRVEIPDCVTDIREAAFYGCGSLTSVTIPDSVTNIENEAFSFCTALTHVTIPNSVTHIGGMAFGGCSGITAFVVAEDNQSYESISGLILSKDHRTLVHGINGKVTVPSGVMDIGYAAFSDLSGLTSVTIPDGVTIIRGTAFFGCSGLTSVTIPGTVTNIGINAFKQCNSLTNVAIGNGVSVIGDGAFYGCRSITSITLPGSVTIIGYGAFIDCTELRTITIPNSVEHIDNYAFSGTALEKVYVASGDMERVKGMLSEAGCDVMGIMFVENIIPAPVTSDPVTPEPTPVQVLKYGGVVDAAFGGKQNVLGALYDAKGSLVGTVQLKFGKKGKKGVKVSASATMLIGGKAKKVGAKAVTLALDGDNGALGAMRSATIAFKAPIGAMAFELAADGTFTLKNGAYEMVGATKAGASGAVQRVAVGGAMAERTLYFNVGIDALPDFGAGMELVEDALPENVPVAVSGTKWTVAKALSLKYQKIKENGSVRYELPIPDGNVAGLKLKCTAKTGQFKGSFKIYATTGGEKPKLKKYTVNVIGFVVDGIGIGEARCKKPAAGPWPVTVE